MNEAKIPAERGPNCFDCRHFAVSWDPALPYSCRLMGFKSRALPAIEVLRADGVFCQGYAPKPGSAPAAAPAVDRAQPSLRVGSDHLFSKYC
ncbi:MAG: hypothetical protein WCK08_07030 [Betaproteobacteria bacterium]